MNVVNREVVGGTANITSDKKVKHDITSKSSLPSPSMDVKYEVVKMATKGSGDKGANLVEGRENDVEVSFKPSGARDTDSSNVDSKHMRNVNDFDYYDEIRPVTEPSIYDSGLSSASQVRG